MLPRTFSFLVLAFALLLAPSCDSSVGGGSDEPASDENSREDEGPDGGSEQQPEEEEEEEQEQEQDAPGECTNGDEETVDCGGDFVKTRTCVDESWQESACFECVDDDVETELCSDGSTIERACDAGTWQAWNDCPAPPQPPGHTCTGTQRCCEPAPGGACLLCISAGAYCP